MAGSPIARRHILHLGGYEPVDPAGLRARLDREFAKHARIAGLALECTPLVVDPDGIAAHWTMTARHAAGDAVHVTYEILRWDAMVRQESAAPVWRLFARVMATLAANLANGVVFRLFRANWRFGLAYLYQYVAFAAALLAPVALGAGAALAASRVLAAPAALSVMVWLAVAAATLPLFLRIARRRGVMQMSAAWVWAHDWARGRRPDFDARVEAFARRLVAAAGTATDEIVVIGHSCGGVATLPLVARALALDPSIARSGGAPRLAILDLGSALPILALHPAAAFAREAIRVVHDARDIAWVEVTALKDPLGCYRFDPAAAARLPSAPRHPVIWGVHLKRMMGRERYARHRLDFIRLHYRYLTANDAPYPYDFPAIVLGPRDLKSRAVEAVEARGRVTDPAPRSGGGDSPKG